MKIYKRHDSATSVLRKMGIKVKDYKLYIRPVENGEGFELDIEKAKDSLATSSKPSGEAAAKSKKKKSPTPTKEAGKPIPCSTVACNMILDGATNEEVWEVIRDRYNLDAKKRHYPSWYRSMLRRQGKLPPREK